MVGKIGSIPLGGVPDDAIQRSGVQVVPTKSSRRDAADRALARPGWAVDGENWDIGVDGGLLLPKGCHSSDAARDTADPCGSRSARIAAKAHEDPASY
jgi:hypothetical protein